MTTIFIADSFSETADTALASHTPETGGGWLAYGSPYSGTALVIAAEGRVAGSSSSSSALYTQPVPPPSADYLVEAVVRFTSSTGKRVGIAARYSDSGTENGYLVFFDGNYWVLRKVVAGVSTDLGSYYGSSSLNTDYVLRFEVFATTLTVSIDGVTRLVASDASIAAAGRVGVLLRSGGRIDSLMVTTLDAQPARLAQMAFEAAISPEPPALLTQSLAEVLSQALVPSRLAQVAVETLVLPFAPARLDQVAVEVLWRDPRLAADMAPRLSGIAQLDLGLALGSEIRGELHGTARLELGLELGSASAPAPGPVTACLAAHLKTDARLRADVAVLLTGRAELRLGEELRASGRLVLIARGRLAGDTPTSSAFWLLF